MDGFNKTQTVSEGELRAMGRAIEPDADHIGELVCGREAIGATFLAMTSTTLDRWFEVGAKT